MKNAFLSVLLASCLAPAPAAAQLVRTDFKELKAASAVIPVPRLVPAAAMGESGRLDATLAAVYQRIFTLTDQLRDLKLGRDLAHKKKELEVLRSYADWRAHMSKYVDMSGYPVEELRRLAGLAVSTPTHSDLTRFYAHAVTRAPDSWGLSRSWVMEQTVSHGIQERELADADAARAETDAKIALIEAELAEAKAFLKELLEALKRP